MENKESITKGFKIFIIIFVLIGLFFIKENNQNKLMETLNSIKFKEKTLKEINTLTLDGHGKIINLYDERIVKWHDNILTYVDLNGELLWQKDFNFIEPDIFHGKEIIYIVDKNTGHIYWLDHKGETINRTEVGRGIFNIYEKDENLIIHTKDENGERIDILDNKGEFIIEKSINKGNFITASLNKSLSKYYYTLLDLDEGKINSILNIYDLNKEELKTMEFPGEIILFNDFIKKDEIITLTDKGLYYIKDNNKLWEREYPLIRDIHLSNNKIYILYGNNLEIIKLNGEREEKIIFPEDYYQIIPFNKYILLKGEKSLIGIEGSRQIFRERFKENILGIYNNDSKLGILQGKEIRFLEIVNKQN